MSEYSVDKKTINAIPQLKFRRIAIEGVIGVGKSTLSKKIADMLHAKLLLEDPDKNPFLPNYYNDMSRYAFVTQMAFLEQRLQERATWQEMDDDFTPMIADFMFSKDIVFAQATLTPAELVLFQQMVRRLILTETPKADLVIYLQASTSFLMKHVQQRNVPYESAIDTNYLHKLNDKYTEFFYNYQDTPVLTVNREHFDFANNPEHLKLLFDFIQNMQGQREFFNG